MKKILLVDDEKDTATVFETTLRQGGFEVSVANSGQQALTTAKNGSFDLILLDQMMPDMQGNEVLLGLKQDQATSQVPVAMLSNFANDELVKKSIGNGAIDYILKYQISPQDLLAKVKGIVGE